jgi:hypothetical protein
MNRKLTREQYSDYIDKRNEESRMLKKKASSLMSMNSCEFWN